MWYAFNDPLKSRDEIMDNVPDGIPRDQWTTYCIYRLNEKTKEMCKRNAEIRKLQTVSHIGGSKPNSRRRAEMKIETGQNPGRAQLYLATHRKIDGSYVNDAAKEICEKIDQALSQSTIDESEISPNDAVGKVLGKEHSGRVRCLGLGVVPSRAFKHTRPRFGVMNGSSYSNGSCSSVCQDKYKQVLDAHNESKENYAQIMNAHTQMMNAFKAYMIMKEGRIREEFAGLFVPPPATTANDTTRRSISPMGFRRSSDGTDSSDNN